jgi:hypothetical protein
MTSVFLDTVGLLAAWDASDQWNVAADIAYRSMIGRGALLLTTPLIL